MDAQGTLFGAKDKSIKSELKANSNTFLTGNEVRDEFKPRTDIKHEVQNVVATFETNVKVDLKNFVWKVRNCEFNEKRFKAVICRLKTPMATALIFENGKVVVTGTKSETLCRQACKHFAKLIRKQHMDEHNPDYLNNSKQFTFTERESIKIQNIVAKIDLEKKINLERFGKLKNSDKNAIECEQDQSIFPGVIWRYVDFNVALYNQLTKSTKKSNDPKRKVDEVDLKKEDFKSKMVVLVFHSGKIIFTGGKSEEEITNCFEYLQFLAHEARTDNSDNIKKTNRTKDNKIDEKENYAINSQLNKNFEYANFE